MPKVSVVASVYNGALYLRPAIDSILEQSFTDFEFVIVDDGSTDDTPHILGSYSDPRIVLVQNKENRGLRESLNRGLAVARGEYIARQDADDLSYPERLARQVAFLDAHPQVGVVGTTAEWVDADGRFLQVWRQPTDNAGIQETMLRYCCLMHGSTMYRRLAVLEVNGYDLQMRNCEDYDLWLKVSERWDMACLPDVLYRYRWHEQMVSREHRPEQSRNAELARARAVQRRLAYGWARLGLSRRLTPEWVRSSDRRWLARRYVWWSAGARQLQRSLALRFLLIALLLDPTMPDAWRYVAGIVGRKAQRLWHLPSSAGESEGRVS